MWDGNDMDKHADYLAQFFEALDLKNAILSVILRINLVGGCL